MVTPADGISSPFAVFTWIAAPALFTNASSLLVLGAGNRLGRTIDRGRQLAGQLESPQLTGWLRATRDQQLTLVERRVQLVLRAITCFYTAMGAFAGSSMVWMVGAGLEFTKFRIPFGIVSGIGLAAASIGFLGLVSGGVIMVGDARLALAHTQAEAQAIRTAFSERKGLSEV
jgi:hypothetical protein